MASLGSDPTHTSSPVFDKGLIWQSYINDDACISEVSSASPSSISSFQDPLQGFNSESADIFFDFQDIADLFADPPLEGLLSWNDLFPPASSDDDETSRNTTDCASVHPISQSLQSPCLYSFDHGAEDIHPVGFLPESVDTHDTSTWPPRPVPPSPSPLPRPNSTPPRCATPSQISSPTGSFNGTLQSSFPLCRSQRRCGSQQYHDMLPDPSEVNYDVSYTSDSALGSETRRMKCPIGAMKSHIRDDTLRRIKQDASMKSCPSCTKKFGRHADVVRHYTSVHYPKTNDEILNDTSHRRLHCLGCKKILSRKDSRERHEAMCPLYCEYQGLSPDPLRTIKGKRRAVCSSPSFISTYLLTDHDDVDTLYWK